MTSDPPRVLRETRRTPAQLAAELHPTRAGRPVHRATVLRWILHGVATPAGVERLEAARVGGAWVTSVEAFGRFAAAQTAARNAVAGRADDGAEDRLEAELAARGA